MQLNINNVENKYRIDIDGLRALAVIAVIVYHFNESILPGGYLGVDVFFVISGFVITKSLSSRSYNSFIDLIFYFYTRRVKRILPALIACIAISSVLISFVNPTPNPSLKTGLFSIFGVSNFFLLQLSADYFGINAKYNLFTHTWSLAVEEQFYLIFPFLFWFSGFAVRKYKGATIFFYLCVTLSSLSVLLFFYLNQNSPNAAFYLMPSRFWEIGIGCILFLIMHSHNNVLSYASRVISPSYIVSLLVFVMFFPQEFHFYASIMATLLSALLIATLRPGYIAYFIFTQPAIVYIGKISYSLYLWHWIVLSANRYWALDNPWIWLPLQIIAIFSISAASYHYLEVPLRRSKWPASSPKILIYGATSSVIAASFIVALAIPLNGALFLGDLRVGGSPVHSQLPCKEGVLKDCIYRENNGVNLFLLGDSHLTNLVPSIKKSMEFTDSNITYYGGVKFIRTIFNPKECAPDQCHENNINEITSYFSSILQKGDVVVFSMSRNRLYLPDHYAFEGVSRYGEENSKRIPYLKDALRRFAESIVDAEAKLILVDDIPSLCSVENVYLSSFKPIACNPSQEISLEDRLPLTNIYLELSTNSELIYYLDPHDTLCPSNYCKVTNEKGQIYVDSSPHISKVNRYILEDFFKNHLPDIVFGNPL